MGGERRGYSPESKPQRETPQQRVADQLITLIENSEGNWLKTWANAGTVENPFSRHRYKYGLNTWVLALSMQNNGWIDPRFGTFKQIKRAEGHVSKGEKGTPIIGYFPIYHRRAEDRQDTDTPVITGFRTKTITVFNVAGQTEGIALPPLPHEEITFSPLELAEQIVQDYPQAPRIHHHGSDRAFYRPSEDAVRIPAPELFNSPESYYTTLFHELIHSTGHEQRLKRQGITDRNMFGSHDYSYEELVAEFGAMMLANRAGMEADMDNSARYLRGWVQRFKDDKQILLDASRDAGKAVAYILNESDDYDSG